MMAFKEERIGPHRLILGDCLEVMPTLGKVDAVVTDAPFGISDAPIKGQGRTGKRTGGEVRFHLVEGWGVEDIALAAGVDVEVIRGMVAEMRAKGELAGIGCE